MISCKHCGYSGTPLISKNGPHLSAYCPECSAYIKHMPKEVKTDFVFYFGKYKGKKLTELTTPQDAQYLHWLLQSEAGTMLKQHQRELIEKHLTGRTL